MATSALYRSAISYTKEPSCPTWTKPSPRGAAPMRSDDRSAPGRTGRPLPGRKRLIDERLPHAKSSGSVQPAAPSEHRWPWRPCGMPCRTRLPSRPRSCWRGQAGDILVRENGAGTSCAPLPGARGWLLTSAQPAVSAAGGEWVGQGTAMGVDTARRAPPTQTAATAGVPHQLHGTVGHPGAGPLQQDRDAPPPGPERFPFSSVTVMAPSCPGQGCSVPDTERSSGPSELRQRLPVGPRIMPGISVHRSLLRCG